jgi:hypothetical protein
MRLRPATATTMFVGAVAAVTGLATPASAATATTPARLQATNPQIHKLTARQAREIIAAARARGVTARIGRRAVVRSAGAASPDVNGGHSLADDCQGFWQVFGGGAAAHAYAYTSVTCKKFQSLFTGAALSRDRFYGWEEQAISSSFQTRGEFANAEAVWGCKGVGTYTYRNGYDVATHYGGLSGTIQTRFTC